MSSLNLNVQYGTVPMNAAPLLTPSRSILSGVENLIIDIDQRCSALPPSPILPTVIVAGDLTAASTSTILTTKSLPVSLNHCWRARCGDRSMEISVTRI
ncbi:unnamed protein product [Ceratitis capitata]|uniref:(Mediterranean fruit fly) hypothetical protein n=1 Tax=Ceratitis capitata TaxID=7213 RepID=A0A811V017_CERCA|nr:unnamed protein product [Ceratitis capitata]